MGVCCLDIPGVLQYRPLAVLAPSASSLVVYERGHLSGAELFRLGLWMTLVADLVVLVVALPYWAAVGEPLVMRPGE